MNQQAQAHDVSAAREMVDTYTNLQGQWAQACTQFMNSAMDEKLISVSPQQYQFASQSLQNAARMQIEAFYSTAKTVNESFFGFMPGMDGLAKQYSELTELAKSGHLRAFDGMFSVMAASTGGSEPVVEVRKAPAKRKTPAKVENAAAPAKAESKAKADTAAAPAEAAATAAPRKRTRKAPRKASANDA